MQFARKLSEIESSFDSKLTLSSKSRHTLEQVPEYSYVGDTMDNETTTSPGIELIYKGTTQDILAIYSVLVYKKNVVGRRYPYDLVVAADFSPNRINEVLHDGEEGVSRFLFSESLQGPYKKPRFDDILDLKVGSSLEDLSALLDRIPFFFLA